MSQKRTWIDTVIQDVDPSLDLVIIENPYIKESYDQILNTIWLPVREYLQKTGHIYTPEIEPLIESDGRGLLTRKMTWMLHEVDQAMYRGAIRINSMGWMIENEFFLSLDSQVNFRLVTELIGNSRMSGCPPELTISKRLGTANGGYFQIKFFNGTGEDYCPGCEEQIIEKVKKCIDTNVEMNDIALDNDWNEERVGEFLSVALVVYEAY